MYNDDYPTCEETYATLCVLHEDLDPDTVTRELSIQPTETWKRGEIRNPGGRSPVVNTLGGWFLQTKGIVQSRDVRRHIDWLLDQMEPRSVVVKKMQAAGYWTRITCYWLSASGHGGPELSPGIMGRLAALGLELGFDVYFLPGEETEVTVERSNTDPRGTS